VKVVAYVPDLMDKSRFGPVTADKTFVAKPDDLAKAESGDVVVADLSRPGSLEALETVTQAARRIGFVSHEDAETTAKAKDAGVEVFPRSRFFSRIVNILGPDDH
jgi:AmiR/NasT family two-component response regulator